MNKRVKVSLLVGLISILLILVGVLIYANFIEKNNNNSQNNSIENSEKVPDKSPEKETLNIKNSIPGTTITDLEILYNDINDTYFIKFKITNNTSENLYSLYTLISLKDEKNKLINEFVIDISTLYEGQTKYFSYETDEDISNVKNCLFETIEIGGVGN